MFSKPTPRSRAVPSPKLKTTNAQVTTLTSNDPRRRVIDLARIRDRLGTHWVRYGDAVFQIAERVVKRELGPRGSYSRNGDTFVVLFEDDPAHRADVIFAKIERTLDEFFFGKGEVAQTVRDWNRRPPPVIRPRRKGYLRQGLHWLLSKFRRGVSSAGTPQQEAQSENPGALQPAAIDQGSTLSPRQQAPFPSLAQDTASLSNGESDTPPGRGHTTGVVTFRNERQIRELEQAILSATIRLARDYVSIPDAHEAVLKRVRIAYRPTWHVSGRAIAVYRATPILLEDDNMLVGDAVLPNPSSSELRMMLDHLTLANVGLHLQTLGTVAQDVLVVIPIHFASFADDRWVNGLLKLCNNLPERVREIIVFESIDAMEFRPNPKFRSVMRLLKPFCCRFGARVRLDSRDLGFWRELGFNVVAVEAAGQFSAEKDLINALDYFSAMARREGLRCAVWGLKSRSLVLSATTMGFNFVHGDMIGSLANNANLERIEFDFGDLYADELDRLSA